MSRTAAEYKALYTPAEYAALPEEAKRYLEAVERDCDLVDEEYLEQLIELGWHPEDRPADIDLF